ncbi:MAG: hypothetical protein ACJ780_09910 [Solirubrobacteraceae bacterium]|jgi:hypothetical protein
MSGIPSGSIVHVGGRTVINRLQDAGLQDPRVPTQTIYETGNDLVVGKVLTEADFRFQLTSWDVSCDLMALLDGKVGTMGSLITAPDPTGTVYEWENCGFVNVTSPWKRDTGAEGGDITAGVIVPNLYATALNYRLGVTDNAQMQVTMSTGAYYMAMGYPMEETAVGNGTVAAYVTSEPAMTHRIGGHNSTRYQWVSGVQVDGVPMIPGVEFTVSGGAAPGVTPTPVTVTFVVPPADQALVRFCYFSPTAHAIPQVDNLATTVTPAAVRGRDISLLLGPPSEGNELFGVQSYELTASVSGQLQRQMGTYDPIGFTNTGIDCSGTVNVEPKNASNLFDMMARLMGVAKDEVYGYINTYGFPFTAVIHDPSNPANIIKSIYIPDAVFQAPGENARVQQVTQFPIRWESQKGTFREVKGALPPDGMG